MGALHPTEYQLVARSIDCQNLTGKRAVVFGDATLLVSDQLLGRVLPIGVPSHGQEDRPEDSSLSDGEDGAPSRPRHAAAMTKVLASLGGD